MPTIRSIALAALLAVSGTAAFAQTAQITLAPTGEDTVHIDRSDYITITPLNFSQKQVKVELISTYPLKERVAIVDLEANKSWTYRVEPSKDPDNASEAYIDKIRFDYEPAAPGAELKLSLGFVDAYNKGGEGPRRALAGAKPWAPPSAKRATGNVIVNVSQMGADDADLAQFGLPFAVTFPDLRVTDLRAIFTDMSNDSVPTYAEKRGTRAFVFPKGRLLLALQFTGRDDAGKEVEFDLPGFGLYAGGEAAGFSGPETCADGGECTLVSVYFGTDRKPVEGADLFGPDRGGELVLGRVAISVPNAGRKEGEIPRPQSSWWWASETEDAAMHFVISRKSLKVFASPEDFAGAVAEDAAQPGMGKDAFVFIHGYWTSFANALYRTAQIAYDMRDPAAPLTTAYLYSWPSGAALLDYIYDLDSARLSAKHLKAFLTIVATQTGAEHIHLVCHSMGCFPLLKAVEAMDPSLLKAKVAEVIAAAPDVDAAEFADIAKALKGTVGGMTLYASASDKALQQSKWWRRNVARAGDIPATGPVLVSGVETIDITAADTSIVSSGHSSYATTAGVFEDLKALLGKRIHPPHVRTPAFTRKEGTGGEYWVFPPAVAEQQ